MACLASSVATSLSKVASQSGAASREDGHASDSKEDETLTAAPARPNRLMSAPSRLGDDSSETMWVTVAGRSARESCRPVILVLILMWKATSLLT